MGPGGAWDLNPAPPYPHPPRDVPGALPFPEAESECIRNPETPVRPAAAASTSSTAYSRRLSPFRALLFLSMLAAGGPETHAGPADQGAGAVSCAAMLDSLDRLHDANRPDYLAWDFAAFGCAEISFTGPISARDSDRCWPPTGRARRFT